MEELKNAAIAAAAEQKDIVLDMQNLTVRFETEDRTVYAVNGVSIQLKKGRTLGLVGETGAGKTTTALSILKLLPVPPAVMTCDKLEVGGYNILELKQRQMEAVRGKIVSMIFQDPMTVLNPVFTVGAQIAEAISLHNHSLTKQEAMEKSYEMLELVGIPRNRAKDYPHQFSGGMKQRVVIAAALSCSPELLIADEPTTALDVTIQAQVLDLMQKLKQEYNMSMILITHDLGIIAEACDDVAVMYAGHIVEHGSLEDVFLRTRHPYTEGLFNSLPNVKDRKAELKPIPGLMPDPCNLPAGCPFEPRCKYAMPACSKKIPDLKCVQGVHYVACAAYEDPNFRIERNLEDSL